MPAKLTLREMGECLMRALATLVLLIPLFSGQVIAPAPTVEVTVAVPGICDVFPYLPGCPH